MSVQRPTRPDLITCLVLFLVLFVSACVPSKARDSQAASPTAAPSAPTLTVRDVRQDAGLLNETVSLEGFVTQFMEDPATSTDFYLLKDDWGGIIRVRTPRGTPVVGKRYHVTGVVTADPALGEVFLHEDGRVVVGETVVRQPVPGWWERHGFLVLVGAIVLVFLSLVMVLMKLLGQPRVPAGAPKPAALVEGSTIKMARAPEGTLPILKGRLAVEKGDERIKEVRFYLVPGRKEDEYTFGRATGPAYTHVQLAAPAVSKMHARLVHSGGAYTLQNLSDTNPTLHQGRELSGRSSVALQDGDRIEMGEVAFVFHAA